MRRNDIVCEKQKADSGHWTPFGRINRINKDGTVQVLDCTKHITNYKPEDLELHNEYKGFWEFDNLNSHSDEERKLYALRQYRRMPRFHRMPTLRKLKIMVRRYAPNADI